MSPQRADAGAAPAPRRLRLAAQLVLLAMAPQAADAGADAALQRVNPSGTSAYELSLAVGHGALGVAWQGGAGDDSHIWFRVSDARGALRAAPLTITDGARAGNEPDLQATGDGWAVSWYEKDRASGSLTAWLAALDRQGQVRWRRALSAAGRQGRNALVRYTAGRLCAVWLEDGANGAVQVVMQRFAPDGRARSPASVVGSASRETWNLNAAVAPDGTLYVVFDAQQGTRAKELQLLRVSPRGDASQLRLGDDDGFESSYPDIVLRAGRAFIAWCDWRDGNAEIRLRSVALRVLSGAAPITAAASPEVRVTTGSEDSTAAYLAWNAGRLALVWNESGGSVADVWLQQFDDRLRPLASGQRLTAHAGQSWIPAVRSWRTGFAIAWDELPATAGVGDSVGWLRLHH